MPQHLLKEATMQDGYGVIEEAFGGDATIVVKAAMLAELGMTVGESVSLVVHTDPEQGYKFLTVSD
jgi:hypothetical protein